MPDENNNPTSGAAENNNILIGDNSKLTTSSEQCEKAALPLGISSAPANLKLTPFLCYAKENTTSVREFRERLKAETWIDPWFDEEDILPGELWEGSVNSAVHDSHAVIIFLSSVAVRSEGFFHKELKLALDAAAEKPDGTIFIIPIRLDVCDVPDRLQPYQYVDYFGDEEHKNRVYTSLIAALQVRARDLGIQA